MWHLDKTTKRLPRLEELRVPDVLDALVSESRLMREVDSEKLAGQLFSQVFGSRVDVTLKDLLKGRYE